MVKHMHKTKIFVYFFSILRLVPVFIIHITVLLHKCLHTCGSTHMSLYCTYFYRPQSAKVRAFVCLNCEKTSKMRNATNKNSYFHIK